MQKKTKTLIPIFFTLILISSLFFVNNVNATISYYNHIQNPSFLSITDYIEDGSFESGLFESGLFYGNWTSVGAGINSEYPHSGVYSVEMDTSEYILYNFTESLLVDDIVSMNGWCWAMATGTFGFRVDYTDESYDASPSIPFTSSQVWHEYDFLGYLDNGKYLTSIKIYYPSTSTYWDDINCLVDDGGGQDSISFDTTPWAISGQRSPSYSLNDILDIVEDVGRLDNSSLRFEHEDGEQAIQWLNYLETGYVHFIDAYVYTEDSTDIYIECEVRYSDGSYDSKYVHFDTNGTWTYINFGKSWVDDNKLIRLVSFGVSVYNYFTGTYQSFNGEVYIDDVGMWLALPSGRTKFNFDLVPYGIEEGSGYFKAYSFTSYVMNCYVYNITSGELNGNGTYRMSDNFGVKEGDIINGFFDIQLDKRGYYAEPHTLENIVITCIFSDEVFSINIIAYWYPIEGGIEDVTGRDETTLDFMFLFIFIFVPSIFLAGITQAVGIPMVGFISGLTIMTSIGRLAGFVPVWFLFVMVLVVVLLILAMLRNGGLR